MLYGDTVILLDDKSSGSSIVYSKAVKVKDFSKMLLHFKEGGYSDVEITVYGRLIKDVDNKTTWTGLLAATLLSSGGTAILVSGSLTGTTQVELLDEAWDELRVGIKNSGGTGNVKCYVSRRRR